MTKINWVRKLIILATAGLFLVSGSAYADTFPYFKVTGGDVWAGGWVDSPASCASSPNYQNYQFSVSPNFPANQNYGGIEAYAQTNGSGKYQGGASGDFGVYALGAIDGSGANYGFASGIANSPSQKDALTFANYNDTSSYWGGEFEGNVAQSHCIPDYYNKLSAGPNGNSVPSLNSVGGAGVYSVSAPSATQPFIVNTKPFVVPQKTKITFYVNGPAYIGSDITYDTKGRYTVDDVSKFALVVQGSLYIGPNVHNLDGLYIAQPDPADSTPLQDDTGDIWTCHDSTTQIPTVSFLIANCQGANTALTVNGSLIAKRINLLRIFGDINNDNAAETINYTPAMVVNGPFFNQGAGNLKIESVVSLPPIF